VAYVGKIAIDVTGTDRAKLLVVELNELERDLELAGYREFAIRLGHAITRFTADKTQDTKDVDGHS